MSARRPLIAALIGVVLVPAVTGSAGARSRGCTEYVSPSGAAATPGRTPRRPTSLGAANARARPGTTICLVPGVYDLSSTLAVAESGTAGEPITYRGVWGRAVLRWIGARGPHAVVWLGDGHDVTLDHLVIDGNGGAAVGVQCSPGGYDLTIRRSVIRDTGAAGVYARGCDYLTVVRNLIYHTGYDQATGWSSGVSLNHGARHDDRGGFHDLVVGNLISGASDESSHHTEGHGIVVDRGGSVPPVLIADNVLYENGGRAVEIYHAQNAWVVNNTAYMNALDLREGSGSSVGDYTANGRDTSNVHFVNDVAFSWTDRPSFQVVNGAEAVFDHDVEFGGAKSVVPGAVAADQRELRHVDPLFQRAPSVDPSSAQQQAHALPPWALGADLVPRAGSALVDHGVDPSTVAGSTPEIAQGLTRYLSRDARGVHRPRGLGWDIGAYEQ